jgi:murein DD-endopeptidase MepM/ murein hydrolase activator NlpD
VRPGNRLSSEGAGSIDRLLLILVVAAASFLVAACTSSADPSTCPMVPRVDVGSGDPGATETLFRLPLDTVVSPAHDADFREHGGPYPDVEYHAAEDYHAPAGTPVYATADGDVSFSGPMGGYGWLVIVDHPWANLYSLYGHLSPSRWSSDPGPVARGDLIGYLGDEWENGGSKEQPLRTHLHFAVRAGLRTDYPGRGEWRWMAGWIKPCPSDLGWLQPSGIIAAQSVPDGGFAEPEGQWLQRWSVELIILALTTAGAIWWIAVGIRRRSWVIPLIAGAVAILGGLYFTQRGFILAPYGFYATAAIGAASAALIALQRNRDRPQPAE